jgi:hypothetical protein
MEENQNSSPTEGDQHQPLVLQPLHTKEFYDETPAHPQNPQLQEIAKPIAVIPETELSEQEPDVSDDRQPTVPLWARLILLVMLCLYTVPIVVLTKNYPWPLLVACLMFPVVMIGRRKVQGIFLPYAVCAGLVLFAVNLLSIIHNTGKAAAIIKYVPIIGDRSEAAIVLAALAVGIGLALLAFATTSYGWRISKVASNVIFRALAVWLIFFAGAMQYIVVDNADYKVQYVTYQAALANYNAETLDQRLPIYAPQPPTHYTSNKARFFRLAV